MRAPISKRSSIGVNGIQKVVPAAEGPLAVNLTRGIQPLGDLGVADVTTLVSGLTISWGNPIPAGGRYLTFHSSAVCPLVSGMRNKADRNETIQGPTSDWVVADTIAQGTPHKVLTYRVQAAYYRSGEGTDGHRGLMSARMNNNVLEYVPPTVSPKVAAVTMATPSCMMPAAPGDDPAIGTGVEAGDDAGFAAGGAWSNEELRAEVLVDLVRFAFSCDLSRVANIMLSYAQCFMNMNPLYGYASDMHELSHGSMGNDDTGANAVADGVAWHVKHWASLMKKLRETEDVDGTSVLDSTAMVLAFEGGSGTPRASSQARRARPRT